MNIFVLSVTIYDVQKRIKDADISRVNEATNRVNDATLEEVTVTNKKIEQEVKNIYNSDHGK
jgi:hypothetical protein